MNSRVIWLSLLLAPILSHAQVCGDAHGRPGTKSVSVTLQPKPESPAFYFREEGDFTTFVSEESLMRALTERERLGDPQIERLAPLIPGRTRHVSMLSKKSSRN
jgi:hypothetical protein